MNNERGMRRGLPVSGLANTLHRDKSSVLFHPQNQYKSDLSFMKGVAWDGVGAPQMESAKKAGELLSEVRMGESGSGWSHLMCILGVGGGFGFVSYRY